MPCRSARSSLIDKVIFLFAASSSSNEQGFKISLTLERRTSTLHLLHSISSSSIQDSYSPYSYVRISNEIWIYVKLLELAVFRVFKNEFQLLEKERYTVFDVECSFI